MLLKGGVKVEQLSEEAKEIELELENDPNILVAYNKIPYALINKESDNTLGLQEELTEICRYYRIYDKGKTFTVEGSNGDYIPARLHYKMAASLIDKEARFLFAESPDIVIEAKGDAGAVSPEAKEALTNWNDLLRTILDKNNFEEILIKAAKDAFIGKRIAGVINFNEDTGVTITFLPSTQFIFETDTNDVNTLIKFVCFIVIKDAKSNQDKKILMKKYTKEDEKIYLEEQIYNGAGALLEDLTKKQEILLDRIPAAIFINDGLSGDEKGVSEINLLQYYEEWYSKLSNGDIDAERKSMNPIRFTVDMEQNSTKGLSSGAGSYWDLQSDQNLETPKPTVGMLESSMSYSDSLGTSLDRIKTTAYEQVDMPNITLETMQGAITSGKALKAIYWPLIVRCKEKMKTWGPQLSTMVEIIVDGSIAYPNTIKKYADQVMIPVAYEVHVEQNIPLPEDEQEEKALDLSEVAAQTMSKKAYMKKWRKLTDEEAEEELRQIALEREILEDSMIGGMTTETGFESEEGDMSMAPSTNTQTSMARLNGVQMNAMMSILTNYSQGIIKRLQAIRLIQSLGVSEAVATEIIDDESIAKQVEEVVE